VYPKPFFRASPNLEDEILLRVVVCHIPKFSKFWNMKINKQLSLIDCLSEISQEIKTFE
jgi:hypothetical protein